MAERPETREGVLGRELLVVEDVVERVESRLGGLTGMLVLLPPPPPPPTDCRIAEREDGLVDPTSIAPPSPSLPCRLPARELLLN